MNLNLIGKQNKHDLLKELDWERLISPIIRKCHFESNILQLNKSAPFQSQSAIEYQYNLLEKFIHCYPSLSAINISHIPSSQKKELELKNFEKGGVGDLEAINHICNLLDFYNQTSQVFEDNTFKNTFNINDEEIKLLIQKVFIPFRKYVAPNGDHSFENHPELSRHFKSLRETETLIRKHLQQIMMAAPYKNALQDKKYDLINDSYVLPIKSDSYQRSHGRIVSKSSTGLTLFVEPATVRDLNRSRIEIESKIDSFLYKLSQLYSEIITNSYPEVKKVQTYVLQFDLYMAKAYYCKFFNLKRPTVDLEKNHFSIKGFFHPMIEDPIKNNIRIEEDLSGLVISGPNTGGKTVVLKTITICYLFYHYGIFLPVEAATLANYQQIYFIGNDHQDINQGLSSFASEVLMYKKLMESLDPNQHALILIDEIFNSTNSEEGSALGASLLKVLSSEFRCTLVISTHHDFLKNFLHQSKKYISAHMIYNTKTLAPTYKLQLGHPGFSHALDIFSQLFQDNRFNEKITDSARAVIDHKRVSYESLLQEVSNDKERLRKAILENEVIQKQILNQKKANESLLSLEKEQIIQKFKNDLSIIQDKALNLVAQAKKGELISVRSAHKKFGLIQSDLTTLAPPPQPTTLKDEKFKAITLDNLTIGHFVYYSQVKKSLKVTQINHRKKTVQLSKDGISIWADLADLFYSKEHSNNLSPKVYTPKSLEVDINFDARGMRLDEFQNKVERYLYSLINDDIPFLNIIHGHGEGILKSWLRNILKNYDGVSWKAEEGNDGCTQITRSKK